MSQHMCWSIPSAVQQRADQESPANSLVEQEDRRTEADLGQQPKGREKSTNSATARH